nr:unnamed protein product [Naegleria fowleri]
MSQPSPHRNSDDSSPHNHSPHSNSSSATSSSHPTASSIFHNFGKSRFWPSHWFQSGDDAKKDSSQVQRDLKEIEQILVKTLEEDQLKKSDHSSPSRTLEGSSSSCASTVSSSEVSSGEALHHHLTQTSIKREIKTTEDFIDREVRLWLSSCKNDSNCPLSPIYTPKLKSIQDIFSQAMQGKNLNASSSSMSKKKKPSIMDVVEEPDIKYYGIDEKESWFISPLTMRLSFLMCHILRNMERNQSTSPSEN